MKISNVQIILSNSFLYVQITTNTGIIGVGESGTWGYLSASAAALESFKSYLIGQDPLNIEHHWQYMYRCFHFRGAALMGALSAIDIALWDIAGKHYNVPVYKLLGGKCRNKIRTYYHVSGSNTDELIASCLKAKKQGYNAIGHLSPFLDEPRTQIYRSSYASMINDAVKRVEAVREALGENIDICLEMHRRLSVAEAISFAQKVEPYTPMFLEDPIVPDNFDSMATIAAKSNIPIATGERIHTIQEFEMLLSRNAMTYVRTSVCMCGGITGARKIAAIAEAHGAMIVPHNPLSPISTAACMQVAASVENFAILELPDHTSIAASERYTSANKMDTNSFTQSNLVDKLPVIENGYVKLFDDPGIGINLKNNIQSLYPFKPREIITRLREDGSIIDQ